MKIGHFECQKKRYCGGDFMMGNKTKDQQEVFHYHLVNRGLTVFVKADSKMTHKEYH